MNLADLFGYISNTTIAGVIPLDIIAHFLLGVLITCFGLKLKFRMKTIAIIIAIPTLIKELFDFQVLNYPLYEPIKDIFVTYLFFLILFFRKFWRRSQKR